MRLVSAFLLVNEISVESIEACECELFSWSQLVGVAGVEAADDPTEARGTVGNDRR